MNIGTTKSNSGRPLLVTAALFVVAGLGLTVPGFFLLMLKGSAYYMLAGLGLIEAGALLPKRPRAGVLLYSAVVVATFIWSFWEVGLDGWAFVPRLSLFMLLTAVLAIDVLSQAARKHGRLLAFRAIAAATAVAAVIGLASHLRNGFGDDPWIAAPPTMLPVVADRQWAVAGGNKASQRFSRLDQITPENVSGLKLAWKVHLGTLPPTMLGGALQATPLMVDDKAYMCNMENVVTAHDIETGKILWRFDPRIDRTKALLGICRGVAFHRISNAHGLCAERILSFANDGRLFAVDAHSGRLCRGFGKNGAVDLFQGMGRVKNGYYYLTSLPMVARNKIIVGGAVLDGQEVGEPSGVVRAYDVVTGKFAWAWDMGRPDDNGMPKPGESFTRGTPNAWAPMTTDDEAGLVYVPTGNAPPDFVSSHRTAEMNEYSSSVVALNTDSGAVRWSFQTTHRDVWDYDVASPPTLFDLPTAKGPRKALIQPTKRGQFFVLDAKTGEPLVRTVEVPVPQGPVPGEMLSPTQPYSAGMPSFGGNRLSERDMWGLTPYDQLWCRIKYRQARYDGEFTPPGLKPTIIYPGYLGGSQWAGVSIDPVRHVMVLNVNHLPVYAQLIPRAEADRMNVNAIGPGHELKVGISPQMGTPYAMRSAPFLSPLGAPCTRPPYSEVAAVDLTTLKTLWRRPLGTARDSGPFGLRSMLPIPIGVPAIGGPLLTGSGLIFIGATQERSLRAIDAKSGQLLWESRLPAGAHAAPMTYYSNRSGRQFIVIPASGHYMLQSGRADWLIAYALPKR